MLQNYLVLQKRLSSGKVALMAGISAIVVYCVTRLINLDCSLWTDEAYQAYDSLMPLGEVAFAAAQHTHMPLDFWVIHFAARIFGENHFAFRFSSILFSCLLAVVLFVFVRKICRSSWAGTFAVLLAASNMRLLYYSQNVHPYSIATFFVLWMYYIGWSLWGEPPRVKPLILLFICCSLGFISNIFFIFGYPGYFLLGTVLLLVRGLEHGAELKERLKRVSWHLVILAIPLLIFAAYKPYYDRVLKLNEDLGHKVSLEQFTLGDNIKYVLDNFNIEAVKICFKGFLQPINIYIFVAITALLFIFSFASLRRDRRACRMTTWLVVSLVLNILFQLMALLYVRRVPLDRFFTIHHGIYLVFMGSAGWLVVRSFLRLMKAWMYRQKNLQRRARLGLSILVSITAVVFLCWIGLESLAMWGKYANRKPHEDIRGLVTYLDTRATPFDKIQSIPGWHLDQLRIYRRGSPEPLSEPRSKTNWYVHWWDFDPPPPDGFMLEKSFSPMNLWRKGPAPVEPDKMVSNILRYWVQSRQTYGKRKCILVGIPRSLKLRQELDYALQKEGAEARFVEDINDGEVTEDTVVLLWNGQEVLDRTRDAMKLKEDYIKAKKLLQNIEPTAPSKMHVWGGETNKTKVLPNGEREIVVGEGNEGPDIFLAYKAQLPGFVLGKIRLRMASYPLDPTLSYTATFRSWWFYWATEEEGLSDSRTSRVGLKHLYQWIEVEFPLPHMSMDSTVTHLMLRPFYKVKEGDKILIGGYEYVPRSLGNILVGFLPLENQVTHRDSK